MNHEKNNKIPTSDKGQKYSVLPPHPGIDCSQIGIHPSQQKEKDVVKTAEKEHKLLSKYFSWRVVQNTIGPLDSVLVDPGMKYLTFY